MTAIEQGTGLVEFLRNVSEIKELLLDGKSVSSIHKKLKNEGKVTLSYTTLIHLIKQTGLLKDVKKNKPRGIGIVEIDESMKQLSR